MNLVALCLSGPRFDQIRGPVSIRIDGTRLVVAPAAQAGSSRLVLPAFVNAHDHGYGIATLACGAPDDALECWIPGLALRPDTDPGLEASVAFGRMALSGIGTTVHCHNSLRRDRLGDEAAAVARAADRVGIRVAFSCPIADRNPHVYGDPSALAGCGYPAELLEAVSMPSGAEQVETALAIRAAHQTDRFNVQLGPIGPQWCTEPLLARIAETAADHDMRIHMHLLETERQRQWLDQEWPEGPIRRLDSLGLLSPRLTIAHGVWLDPDECALLAERGVTVAVNTSSNLRLRSGVAPVADYAQAGLNFALGLDGAAFDDDQDMFREQRLFRRLQSGMGLDDKMPLDRVLRAMTRDAYPVFNGSSEYGVLETGAVADFMMLDASPLLADRLNAATPLQELLFARLCGRHVRRLFVGGREVVRDGALAAFDFAAAESELIAQARSAPGDPAISASATSRREAVRRYYLAGNHLR